MVTVPRGEGLPQAELSDVIEVVERPGDGEEIVTTGW